MTRRLTFVVPQAPDPWRRHDLRAATAELAAVKAAQGWCVEVVAGPDALETDVEPLPDGRVVRRLAYDGPPVVGSPGRAGHAAALRAGYKLMEGLRGEAPDAVIGPLAGGLMQPLLMSRATGEAFQQTRVLLWAEASTRRRVRLGHSPDPIASAVEDALEVQAVRMADGFVGSPSRIGLPDISAEAWLETPSPPGPEGRRPAASREFVFVGPGASAYGLTLMLEALEVLQTRRSPADFCATFIGPWIDEAQGVSKRWLGLRALGWDFPFRLIDTPDPERALAHLAEGGGLAVFAGSLGDDDMLHGRAQAMAAGVIARAGDGYGGEGRRFDPDAEALADHFETWLDNPWPAADAAASADLIDRLDAGSYQPQLTMTCAKAAASEVLPPWGSCRRSRLRGPTANVIAASPPPPLRGPTPLVGKDQTSGGQAPPLASISVCITHLERPAELAQAVASITASMPMTLDIRVIDLASRTAAAQAVLHNLEREGVHVRRSSRMNQGRARNLVAEDAPGDILVFLDDDNRFTPGGLDRLVAPLARGEFDVCVSNLDLDQGGEIIGRRLFIGEAGAAGLMFNALGDANFAIRKQAFASVGGFHLEDVSALDWRFLSRAVEAGLRLCVAQAPCITYRCGDHPHASAWKKISRHDTIEGLISDRPDQRERALFALCIRSFPFDDLACNATM